jgi:hypothetical protein
MNDYDFERYKKEMMKMYGKRKENNDPPLTAVQLEEANEETPGEAYDTQPEEIENVDSDAPDDTSYSPHYEGADTGDRGKENYNTRYPEPDLSELGSMEQEDTRPPEYINEESLGSSKGYILVNVRTGDESAAVSGATVLVTAIVAGNRIILASGMTDRNGTAPLFEVPVPAFGISQSPSPDSRPYNLFDVSVTAEGFFNARSVDVPVFSGITSVQNFNMIPVPALMMPSDETVTYYNQEPFLTDSNTQGG